MRTELRLPAIEVRQSLGRTLYTFAVDAKLVPRFAAVSRIRRSEEGSLCGYQRPEVRPHVDDIRTYIEGTSPMIPNAVVLAFDARVRFEAEGSFADEYARPGHIVIPMDDDVPDEERPGVVVDGQQRLAAIREARVNSFPICVSAFLANSAREQTEQFILVNATKPLPKKILHELLPSTEAILPPPLLRRRLPAYLLSRLNHDSRSPLRGMIRTATNPAGLVEDGSMLKALENSLRDGLLYRLEQGNSKKEGGNVETMITVLCNFWRAASRVFDDAWGLPPRRSRLMHGAGVVSLASLMDAIAERHRSKGVPAEPTFVKDLTPLKEVCRWADGWWDFGPGQQRKWNEIQSTSKDIRLLAGYLLVQYKALVWSKPLEARGEQLSLF